MGKQEIKGRKMIFVKDFEELENLIGEFNYHVFEVVKDDYGIFEYGTFELGLKSYKTKEMLMTVLMGIITKLLNILLQKR